MGLSIHYNGHIKEAKLLPSLIEEVKDVSETYGWKYHIYEEIFPNEELTNKMSLNHVFGISFTPSNCETLSLTFLNTGIMVCPARLTFFGNSQNEEEKAFVYTVSVKTQYGGVVLHQFIIHFLKYLNSKYFKDFSVSDESDYWETGDEQRMRSQFKNYDTLLDNFSLALETFPIDDRESMIDYINRLVKNIHDLKK